MFDRFSAVAPVALNNSDLKMTACAQMDEIRAALGVVPVAEPAVFWLYLGQDTNWYVRKEGDADEHAFPTRDQALQSMQLGALRCASYCLFLQDSTTGRFTKECSNWPANRP